MTVTSDFLTENLYPGATPVWDSGAGKWKEESFGPNTIVKGCKVGTEDLFPSEVWKVNVSMSDLHKWMWNLEEWSSNFDVSLEDSQGGTLMIDASLSTSGKNHYADVSAETFDSGDTWSGVGRVLDEPPNKRVCGSYFQTSDTDSTSPVNATGTEERLLPFAGGSIILNFEDPLPNKTVSGSFNISDGSGTVGGVTFSHSSTTESIDNFLTANIEFYYIRLLGDGTADVYFLPYVVGDADALYGYDLTRTDTGGTYRTSTSVNLSVLGQTVGAYISVYDTAEFSTPSAVTSFSFTYAISVTTAYTY